MNEKELDWLKVARDEALASYGEAHRKFVVASIRLDEAEQHFRDTEEELAKALGLPGTRTGNLP